MNTHNYRHTENISLDFEPNSCYLIENKQKFLNPWLICILKHHGVMRQIPGLTSLPLTLTARKSTKITFSNDKIYIAILITGFQILCYKHDIGTLIYKYAWLQFWSDIT